MLFRSESRHAPSARAMSSIGRGDISIPMTPLVRLGLQRTAARRRRTPRTDRAPSTRSACSGTGAIIRSHVTGGSNHWARVARQGRVAESGRGTRRRSPRRHTGDSTRRGSFARPLCGLIPRNGSRGPFAENGGRASCVVRLVWPPLASPRAARRVNPAPWHSRTSGLARAHSTGRPTRKWSRRARRSCAILSPWRAARLQRWADTK